MFAPISELPSNISIMSEVSQNGTFNTLKNKDAKIKKGETIMD